MSDAIPVPDWKTIRQELRPRFLQHLGFVVPEWKAEIFSDCPPMHPYEKLFAALRDKMGGWEVSEDGELRRNCLCPLEVATGGNTDAVCMDDDARCCLGMSNRQIANVMFAADGCGYSTCGYADLMRKLYHYLGVLS